MTVSRVANRRDNVSEPTRERVLGVMREVGYLPNQLARGLASGGLRMIALIVPDITHAGFTEIAHTVESVAAEHGFMVVLGNSDGDVSVERDYVEKFTALKADGIIVASAADQADESMHLLRASGTAFVLLDREVRGVQADVVAGESVKAIGMLTEHLIKVHGHSRISLISGPASVSTSRDRVKGFTRTMRKHGLQVTPGQIGRAPYTRESGRELALQMLQAADRPTAVIGANSPIACGVLDAARELRMEVPGDVAVVTFDDVEVPGVSPFLTCVERPPRRIGELAIETLLSRLAGDTSPPRSLIVPADLRVRRSCGCELPDGMRAGHTTSTADTEGARVS